MHPLLEESKKVKEQAERLIHDSNIVSILSDYGEVKIGGSYTLDVMLRPDLDFFVVAEKHDWNKVKEIYSAVMESKFFQEFDFVNWVDFMHKDPTDMKGYYFQPWVPYEDVMWKIDIWLITPDEDKSGIYTDHFKALLGNDESKRITILEIKEAMRDGMKYTKGVDGKMIYKAVLEEGVTSVLEFKEKFSQ